MSVERTTEPGQRKSWYYSILLHSILILIVVIGIDWKTRSVSVPRSAPPVMNATAVDSHQVAAEVEKLKQADQAKAAALHQRQRDAENKVNAAQAQLEKLKHEQVEVKRQKEAENAQLEAERRRLETDKAQAAEQRKHAEADKQRLEREVKKAAEEKKKQDAETAKEAAEDAKKRAAEEKKAKAEDDKKRASEDKRRAAEEKRKRDAAKEEAALKDALAAEEAEQAEAAQASADQTELARYVARIQNAVTGAFVYPDMKAGLKCTLFVRVVAGGEVVEARVTESSGNPVFDRQAENAVRKASPLPVPDEARLFQQMREFNFVFAPET